MKRRELRIRSISDPPALSRRLPRSRAVIRLALALLLLVVMPDGLAAHGEAPTGWWDVWHHWPVEPAILASLALATFVYYRGISRLWSRAGAGRGVGRWRALSFGAGIVTLGAALLSPLDPLGSVLFSAHMTQHLLLILVAAPLLVAGAPEFVILWAVPHRWRRRLGRLGARLDEWTGGGHRVSGVGPLLIILVTTGVLWVWHLPGLYDLAVRNDAVHALEHASFLGTALLFWAMVLRLRPRDRRLNGLRILYLLAMVVQGSILGALITFAGRPLYLSHAAVASEVWGISSLEDQQLAGLIMWVPPALLYVAVAARLFIGWLEELEADRDRATAPGG